MEKMRWPPAAEAANDLARLTAWPKAVPFQSDFKLTRYADLVAPRHGREISTMKEQALAARMRE